MKYLDTTTSEVSEICNLFARYFQSVYSSETVTNYDLPSGLSKCVDIGSLVLCQNEIEEALLNLDLNKSEGPDKIPPFLLRKCAIALAQPLTNIFNISLATGQFLKTWKISFLSPIFKSGSKQEVTNYRPICKLSAIPKLFEKVVYNKISSLIQEKISVFQHGFVVGKSTATNLTIMVNAIINNMEKGFQTDIIFTDFAKAFDRVNHKILLHKLLSFGISSSLLNWFESYLTGRVQIVKIKNFYSDDIYVPSGVPQGSHLGPLLFLIFVNDIPTIFKNSDCLLFADDLKIYRRITCISDCSLLLEDLVRLVDWCRINNLHLNVEKCQILSCFRILNPIVFDFNIDNIILTRVNQKKDLGVILDVNLSFLPHYDYLINKANQMLGFIKRNTREFTDSFTLLSLYNSLVRSVLEYCCTVWNPYYANTSERIEKIQRNFTRYAFFKLNWRIVTPSYETRCLLFGIKTLEARRKYFSIMFVRDIITNHVNCPPLAALVHESNAPLRITRERFLIYEQFHRTNYGRNEPISRCIRESNLVCSGINFYMDCTRETFKSIVLNKI